MADVKGSGTADDPWVLTTPPGSSEYTMHRDEAADPPALICQVGSTKLSYQLRCLEDLHSMRTVTKQVNGLFLGEKVAEGEVGGCL